MPTDISMPRLGLTMEEGTVVRWLAAEGELVVQGQPLLEVETDKVTVEVEAQASGVLGTLEVHAGEKARVGALLARLYAAEEEGERKKEEGRRKIFSSPRARWRARGLEMDWRALVGSGPRGRVIERDVLAAAAQESGAAPMVASTGFGGAIFNLQSSIFVSVEVVAEALLKLHTRLAPVVEKRAGVQLTVTDLLVRICGAALAQIRALMRFGRTAASGCVRRSTSGSRPSQIQGRSRWSSGMPTASRCRRSRPSGRRWSRRHGRKRSRPAVRNL